MKPLRLVSMAFVLLAGCSSSVVAQDGSGDTGSAPDVRDTATIIDTGVDTGIDAGTGLDVTDVTTVPDGRPPRDVMFADIPPFDSAHEGGVSCGTDTCTGGQICCGSGGAGGTITFACADSCPDASVPIACSGPENCSGDPCCAQLGAGGAAGFVGEVSCTSAPTECVPMINIATMSGQTRLCHVDSDCAPSTQLPSCCTITQGGAMQHVCLNTAIVGFLPGATCP